MHDYLDANKDDHVDLEEFVGGLNRLLEGSHLGL